MSYYIPDETVNVITYPRLIWVDVCQQKCVGSLDLYRASSSATALYISFFLGFGILI